VSDNYCNNCGLSHAPDDASACIEGHGEDPIQVTVHGRIGSGPVDLRTLEAFAEMIRCAHKMIEDGAFDNVLPADPTPREAEDGD
jgi:hypothetical protein